ncbi:MAG TPA: hypothetical protein ENH28_00245 [Euryarchaeota archaeon]|nr:hypothetical protein [Euryarchaeota archaeon]
MQKLLVEFQNTPEDAPQVLCSVSEVLNRDKSLSVPRTVLANNNSAQDQHSGKSGQVLSVPVINMHGKPLMPTTPGKARILLKQGKATVVQ